MAPFTVTTGQGFILCFPDREALRKAGGVFATIGDDDTELTIPHTRIDAALCALLICLRVPDLWAQLRERLVDIRKSGGVPKTQIASMEKVVGAPEDLLHTFLSDVDAAVFQSVGYQYGFGLVMCERYMAYLQDLITGLEYLDVYDGLLLFLFQIRFVCYLRGAGLKTIVQQANLLCDTAGHAYSVPEVRQMVGALENMTKDYATDESER